jgi:hypothetical protein
VTDLSLSQYNSIDAKDALDLRGDIGVPGKTGTDLFNFRGAA